MTEEGYISDITIWKMRYDLDPPHKGLVMFSSSGAEYNIEQLIEMGVDENDCYEVDYSGNDTVWIPLKDMKSVNRDEYENHMEILRAKTKATLVVRLEIDNVNGIDEAKEKFETAIKMGSDNEDAFYDNNVTWEYKSLGSETLR
tara:strand:+ start:426 stop:857 length:432 start_codon:yes stop_codon:yes gene_type:complete